MPTREAISWFKREFAQKIRAGTSNTPFTVDMLTAIACQETGYIWAILSKRGLATADVLKLCVGDSIDAKPGGGGRRAFPKNRAELEGWPNGPTMFAIGHQALIDVSKEFKDYAKAAQNPNKFCRGYGIFQFDLQHFKTDPDYFLKRQFERFPDCLHKCVTELEHARRRVGLSDRQQLTDAEMAMVAIAYNRGTYKASEGLKQGHFDGQRYYGQAFADYLKLSKTIAEPNASPAIPPPPAGEAIVSPPTQPTAAGDRYVVDTRGSDLRVRREPKIDPDRPRANVITELPDRFPVRAVGTPEVKSFLEIETSLRGAFIRGYAAVRYLRKVQAFPSLPAAAQPAASIPEAHLPRRMGLISRRKDPAGAYSLNEKGQPRRVGTSPAELRSELGAIIKWLAVDDPANKRYLGGAGKTFCNIYAHDYCSLAGVYLPRCWWNGAALMRLASGEDLKPIYGQTVDELRANDLFRWLRDFGQSFGWRQTGTVTKLQAEVQEGAIGLIVARRKIDGKSGHIVPVVPETTDFSARRDADGEVTSPLQSQAGVTNFQYGHGRPRWWQGGEFAEHAFWLHA